ncbi:ribosome maturation factor RimP [Rickettsiales bacterium LUAb2]
MNKVEIDIMNEIAPSLIDMGYSIVRVSINNMGGGENSKKVLQIMIENLNESPITIGDCSKASKHLSAFIDLNNLINGKYMLEVSSAGINRPLVFAKDFIKYIGSKANLKLKLPVNESKSFKGGIINHADENSIKYFINNQEIEILLSNIAAAELDIDLKI